MISLNSIESVSRSFTLTSPSSAASTKPANKDSIELTPRQPSRIAGMSLVRGLTAPKTDADNGHAVGDSDGAACCGGVTGYLVGSAAGVATFVSTVTIGTLRAVHASQTGGNIVPGVLLAALGGTVGAGSATIVGGLLGGAIGACVGSAF